MDEVRNNQDLYYLPPHRRLKGINFLIDFSHPQSRNCCELAKTHPEMPWHNDTFRKINTAKGTICIDNINEWVEVNSLKGTWGGSEIIQIFCNLTGATVFTHNIHENNPASKYTKFVPNPKISKFPNCLGLNIILERDSTHYSLIVRKTFTQTEEISPQQEIIVEDNIKEERVKETFKRPHPKSGSQCNDGKKKKVEHKEYSSRSKSVKVKCRVCQEEVMHQNYGRHLEKLHKSENPKDTRVLGQDKFSFFPKMAKKEKARADLSDTKLDSAANVTEKEKVKTDDVINKDIEDIVMEQIIVDKPNTEPISRCDQSKDFLIIILIC